MAASSKYKLIVGLGNPGDDYRNTYHNVGFLFVDYLFKNSGFKTRRNFEYAKAGNIIVVKPLTFMNQSGEAVLAAIRYFSTKGGKIEPKEILIIHDDSDIELGKYKISADQGSAGHKGVLSVMQALKTKELSRIRIGVRMPKVNGVKIIKAGEFVLRKIKKDDLHILQSTFEKIKNDAKLKALKSDREF